MVSQYIIKSNEKKQNKKQKKNLAILRFELSVHQKPPTVELARYLYASAASYKDVNFIQYISTTFYIIIFRI